MKLVNKKGFTLAEVLLTVGIIGVVAAITMPSLMSGWQNKAYSTMARRFYSLYNQAIETMIKDDMALNINESRTARIAVNSQDGFWPKYFHLIENCEQNYDNCFASTGYKTGNNAQPGTKVSSIISGMPNNNSYYAFVLVSGESVASPLIANGNSIIVDLNGKKGPNTLGKDFWIMNIDVNGDIGNDDAASCAGNDFVSGCFAKLKKENWTIK
ncbi:MAG: type II secretion system GspH family protein [Clostridiaceae bacterium]|jgi:prepilin-type N-terminal cleavage/methylation domain-containing protein|nr:type II secretion system GspH family protein [Clostridiaceae bacterium]